MSAVKNGVVRMMSWDHSAFVLKQALDLKSGARFEMGGGGGGHSLIWHIQVRYVLLNTRS